MNKTGYAEASPPANQEINDNTSHLTNWDVNSFKRSGGTEPVSTAPGGGAVSFWEPTTAERKPNLGKS